jgi:hypothetical protein
MTFRVLPESEWPRLVEDGIEPFVTEGLPEPGHWVFVVAEDAGHIVGCSSLVETVQNHWWMAPAVRRSITTFMGLCRATKAVLDAHHVPVIHTTVPESHVDLQAMLERIGFVEAEGKLYILKVDQAVVNERVG